MIFFRFFTFHFLSILGVSTLSSQDVFLNDPFGVLYSFDFNTCAISELSNTQLPITDIAMSLDGVLYGVDISGNLYTLIPEDGSSNSIFTLPPPPPGSEYNSLTIDHENILYIIGLTGILYFYDLKDQTSGVIANLNIQAVGDMVFTDRDNLAILISGDRLYNYNLETNEGEILQQLPSSRGTILSTFESCNRLSFYSIQNSISTARFNEFSDNWFEGNVCNVVGLNRLQIFGSTTNSEALNRTLITIENLSVSNIICNRSLGAVTIQAEGGYETLSYSIDGMNFQSSNRFENLESGNHTIYVNDSKDCPISDVISIQLDQNLLFDNIDISASDCNGKNGSLMASLSDLNEDLDERFKSYLQLNSIDFGNELNLVLDEGEYTLSNIGCGIQKDTTIFVPSDSCGFYIPNVLSTHTPLQQNNLFSIQFENPNSVLIKNYQIFDEWGSIIYEKRNFMPAENPEWWDGQCDDAACETGVYGYRLNFELGRSVERSITGSILLIN